MAFAIDDCIRLMPEWDGRIASLQELKGGITNTLHKVTLAGGEEYVVRLYGKKTELFIDRIVEMENLRRLEPLGVTPRLVRFLPGQNATIVSFIPGYVLCNGDFLNAAFWNRIVAPIRTIHRSGITLPSVFHPLREVKRLSGILEEMPRRFPEFDIRGTIRRLETIAEILDISHREFVPCHNDLLADNFVLAENPGRDGGAMCLIDWEYGGMAPADYDLADMFQEILIPREAERGILAAYWRDDRTNEHQYRTDLFKPFPDIYWFLWSLIQLNVSEIPFDYYTYGKTKYENALGNMESLRSRHGLNV